jgi:hypothetical protein
MRCTQPRSVLTVSTAGSVEPTWFDALRTCKPCFPGGRESLEVDQVIGGCLCSYQLRFPPKANFTDLMIF